MQGDGLAAVSRNFPGGSRQSRLISLAIRSTIKPLLRAWSYAPWLPWPYRAVDHLGRLLPIGDVAFESVRLADCWAEVAVPRCSQSGRYVVYLHGGGFYVGGRYLHRHMVSRFASALSTPVMQVNYRKLPKNSIADAVRDGVTAYRHVLDLGIDPSRIVVMGDSAGAYLTFTTALGIRDQGLPMPGALVAISPLGQWEPGPRLTAESAGLCAVFPRATPGALLEIAVQKNGAEGLVSPAHCDLAGLPPTLIQASSSEIMHHDAVLMAERLTAHGVSCELQVWPGQVHVFQAAAPLVPESEQAVNEVVSFIDNAVPAAARTVA